MSKLTLFIAIAIVILGSSAGYPMVQPITAQNMTGNQSGNLTAGLDLLPPGVVEEETQAEILEGQQ